MRYIDRDGDKLPVFDATVEDLAAVRASLRAHPGPSAFTEALIFNTASPFKVTALCWAGLPWPEAAMQEALRAESGGLAPRARLAQSAAFGRLKRCAAIDNQTHQRG